ncbi:type II secretion system F family protein [Methylobacter psychrophilus]|uniref:type II secretion system F family protein n=1 Tax=Methylobacter psychrophilus TaxID=96941 RepID=UPI0021D50033|nr:type II secretion system F family protein [Methylobacter psychrophilus]
MAHFKCTARNAAGQLVTHVVEAEDRSGAAHIITSRGLTPVSITLELIKSDLLEQINHWHALNSLSLADMMLFSRQMHSLSKAGVPLIRALQSLTESTRNPALAGALKDITKRLESGSPISQAMNQHKKIFSPLFINIVNVGEASGELDQAFLQIANYLEREKETQSRIKSAFRYPTMVIIAISIAMGVINIYVIPSFKSVFDRMQAELPWQTKLLMTISNFTVSYWPYILGVLLALATIFIKYINTTNGRLQWDWLKLHIPGVGSIVERSIMERFARSFAMTLSSGVPLIQGISIVSTAIGNSYIASKLEQMRIGIEKGDSISRMARSTQLFPPLVIQMIMVGEETGNISEMLLEVADFYETEVDAELKNIASVIEPFLIVIIGIMVLIMALGIFLPMWNLSRVMH